MNLQEFNNEFDILFNSISSNNAPSLNEYEKSVFLTQAQEEVVIASYTGTLNGESFESAEEVKTYIQNLLETFETSTKLQDQDVISNESVVFLLPEKVWYPVYEQALLVDQKLNCGGQSTVIVKPITHDHYYKTKENPFKGSNNRRVLRLSLQNGRVELISKYNVDTYIVRYIKQPKPIIIEDLDGYGLSINGITKKSECELNSAIHRIILKRAVDIARSVWG